MKLKLTDAGDTAVVLDGKPVFVADDGREIAFDYDGTIATIKRLNDESKSYRERAESVEGRLKAFEGIEDPVQAREALQKVKDVAFGTLIHAGKIDEVKAEAKKVYDEQLRAIDERYKPTVDERDALRNQLFQEKIGGSFSRSKYISEKMAIPPDLVQARFGPHFTIDEGRVVAKDNNGNQIYSRANPGNVADFDEALEVLVGGYPYRDAILKGTGASGSGANGSARGTNAAGKQVMTRAQFDGLAPIERARTMSEGKTELIDE